MSSNPPDIEQIVRGVNRVQLHASEPIADAATELHQLCMSARETRDELLKIREEKGGWSDEDLAGFRREAENVGDKRREFIRTARAEYSHPEIS